MLLVSFLPIAACVTTRFEPKERADFQKAALAAASDEQVTRARETKGQKTPADLSVLLAYGRLLATVTGYQAVEQLVRNLSEHQLCHKGLDPRQVETQNDALLDKLDALDAVARAQSAFQGWLGSYPTPRAEARQVLDAVEQSLSGADRAYDKNCRWTDLEQMALALKAYLETEEGKTLKSEAGGKPLASGNRAEAGPPVAHRLLLSVLCHFHGCDPARGDAWVTGLK